MNADQRAEWLTNRYRAGMRLPEGMVLDVVSTPEGFSAVFTLDHFSIVVVPLHPDTYELDGEAVAKAFAEASAVQGAENEITRAQARELFAILLGQEGETPAEDEDSDQIYERLNRRLEERGEA